ncbi:MAG: AraC family transcriptional regulator, partial [Bacteroidales bacterium]|nr:AraC family transcriptional regulator [Bacteroidales bacterium]
DDTDLSEVSEEKTIKEVADISVTEKTEFQIQLNMLDKYMAQNKPYLDAEICLQDLANKIQLSRHQLSALINNEKDMNFYEFINSYRVEEIKKLMSMPENKAIKLLSLAYDAGFNSKSSFNRIFKQSTGTTPSAYFSSLDKE